MTATTKPGTLRLLPGSTATTAYALVSLYWAVGGHRLVSTVGGYVERFARQGGAIPVLVALAAAAAKVAGGLLALALVRPWGVPSRTVRCGSRLAGRATARPGRRC
jgi:hypothetical protein